MSHAIAHRLLHLVRRRPQWQRLLLSLGLCAAAACLPAHAEVAAQADFVHGQVTATRSGDASRTLAQGGDIYDQDTLRTAASARAQLRFTDGGVVSLLPETTFSVQEYRLGDAGADGGSLVFSLLSGGLRTVTGAIGKTRHEAYELKTPVGTLGIRGTEYTAVLNPPGTLRVHVGRGKVVLSNDNGTLEVGEGVHAIMTLEDGPALNDQAPQAGMAPAGAASSTGGLSLPDPAAQTDPMGIELPLPGMGDPGMPGGGSGSSPGSGPGGTNDPGGCPNNDCSYSG